MPSLVHDIGLSLLAAGVLGVIFTRLKIPSIAAFLLAGVLIGPIGLKQVTDPVNIDTIAQLGFILLLFLIGLEIDFKKILGSGKSIIISGLLQYPLTILFGVVMVKLMVWLGIGGTLLAESPYAALYMGVVIAGSSTLLVVKLFQEHFELDTVPGRLALGMLIFQDIWVIVAILIQPNLQNPEISLIAMSFLGILLLSLFTVVIALSVVGRAFTWIAKTPEMTLLGALAWCFVVVFIGVNLDNIFDGDLRQELPHGGRFRHGGADCRREYRQPAVIYRDHHQGGDGEGLSSSRCSSWPWVSASRCRRVSTSIVVAVVLAVLAILARQFIFFPLFYFTGVDQRNAEVSSIRLAQISEFGLVIAFLGVKLGHLSPALTSSVIFAFVITALATPLMYGKAYEIHGWVRPLLEKCGFKAPPELTNEEGKGYKLALLGFHRDASSLLYNLSAERSGPGERNPGHRFQRRAARRHPRDRCNGQVRRSGQPGDAAPPGPEPVPGDRLHDSG